MRLYLVRHGEAEALSPDFARRLTAAGRASVERLGTRAAAAGVRPEQIRHSGLLRARETAEILARLLSPSAGIGEMAGIGPDDDEEAAAIELGLSAAPLLVVTHMPFVLRLTGRLLAGRRSPTVPPYGTSELRGFELDGDRWTQVLALDGEV